MSAKKQISDLNGIPKIELKETRKLSKNRAWFVHCAVRLKRPRCGSFCWRRRRRRQLHSADHSWFRFFTSRATKRLNLTPFSQKTGSRLRIDDLDTFMHPLHHKTEQKSTRKTANLIFEDFNFQEGRKTRALAMAIAAPPEIADLILCKDEKTRNFSVIGIFLVSPFKS